LREKLQKIIKQFFEGDNYTISIAIALTIAFILLIFSYIAFMKPNEFVSFSILDEQKEAKNYPELLVIGENNTCKLWIVVENRMEKSINCEVRLKITNQPIQSLPLQMKENGSYSAVLNKGETWEKLVEISFNEKGDFHLVFELWIYDEKTDTFEFSNNFCVLTLKVIEA
jgi:uncharacterized membrane protein